jgi:tRNA (adenine-N(1)-)-methyltransferase non-catalytic subunit
VEISSKLFRDGSAVNIDVTETWMREYQVLPGRSHPLMRMDNASGYILTGIKVSTEATLAPEQPATKKLKT